MFRKIYFLLILVASAAMLWLAGCEWMKFPPAPVCQKQENEPVKTANVSTTEEEADCVLGSDGTVEYRGRFRHRWWNYYKRAMCFAEKGCWEQAIKDFEKAIEQRGKDEKDQWGARTYGMRFIDYFPNREMGIAYYYLAKNDIKKIKIAQAFLELSVSQTPSAKAISYLEEHVYAELFKVPKDKLKEVTEEFKQEENLPDFIKFSSNLKDFIQKEVKKEKPDFDFSEMLKLYPKDNGEFLTTDIPVNIVGKITDKNYYISSIEINHITQRENRNYPVFLLNTSDDLPKVSKTIPFKKQLSLSHGTNEIEVKVKNITGNVFTEKIKVNLKLTGPLFSFNSDQWHYNKNDNKLNVKGILYDRTGISKLYINNQSVPIPKGLKEISFDDTVMVNNNIIELTAYDCLGNKIKSLIPLYTISQEPALVACNNLLATDGTASSNSETQDEPVTLSDSESSPEIKFYTWVRNEKGSVEEKELSQITEVIDVYLNRVVFIVKVRASNNIKSLNLMGESVDIPVPNPSYYQDSVIIELSDMESVTTNKITVIDTTGREKSVQIKTEKSKEKVKIKKLKDSVTDQKFKPLMYRQFKNNNDNEIKKIVPDISDGELKYSFREDNVQEYTISFDGNPLIKFREMKYEPFKTKNRYGIFIFPFFPEFEEGSDKSKKDILYWAGVKFREKLVDNINKIKEWTEDLRFQINNKLPDTQELRSIE
ncbi:MAG: hypothetical protein BWK80_17445, partial [Desulfobacteraceae bacterium IS3]